MLSWEYPPVIVGGLGRHVDALSRALVAAGHDVCVVTRGGAEPPSEVRAGVRIRRAAVDPLEIDFTTESLLAWTQAFEHGLIRAALPIVRRWRPDVIHAHDWLVAQSAVTLTQVTGAPIVATVHATEAGRHQGWLPAPLNRAVHSVEKWLVDEAARVITCSTFMREDVASLFGADHVEVVPNGLDADLWQAPARARLAARARYAGDGPLLVLAGRLVHEKGVHVASRHCPGCGGSSPASAWWWPERGRWSPSCVHRPGGWATPCAGPGSCPTPTWPPCSARPTRCSCRPCTNRSG
jgi:glycogen(starch) synthase